MQGNDKLLERMYCFKGVEESTRVVVHVHTLIRWGDRGKLHPNIRARKVCHSFRLSPLPHLQSRSSSARGNVSGNVSGAVGAADPAFNISRLFLR